MLKKLITLAATTAMLGANVAAHAVDAARSALRGAGAAGEGPKPVDGTKIQPSIPPMPPMEKAQPAPRKASGKTDSANKGNNAKATKATARATKAAKPTKASPVKKPVTAAKASHRKTRNSVRRAK